jgi:hypothetical protein
MTLSNRSLKYSYHIIRILIDRQIAELRISVESDYRFGSCDVENLFSTSCEKYTT